MADNRHTKISERIDNFIIFVKSDFIIKVLLSYKLKNRKDCMFILEVSYGGILNNY